MRRKLISVLVLISLIVVLVLFIAYVLAQSSKPGVSPGLSLTGAPAPAGLVKAPKPYLLLPQGKQEFTIRSGTSTTPVGTKIVADPLDAPKDSQQSVSLDVNFKTAIDSVSARVITDNKETVFPMKLTAGTNLSGTWTGTWTMPDTHENIFSITFLINYSGKQSTIDFPIR